MIERIIGPKQFTVPDSIFEYWNRLNKLFPQMNLIMGIGLGKQLFDDYGYQNVMTGDFAINEKQEDDLVKSMTDVHTAYGMPAFMNDNILIRDRAKQLLPYNIKLLKNIVGKMREHFSNKGEDSEEKVLEIYTKAEEIISSNERLKRLGIKLKSEVRKSFIFIRNYCKENNLQVSNYKEVMQGLNSDARYLEIRDRIIVIKKTIFNYLMKQLHISLNHSGNDLELIDLKKFFS